MNDLWAVVITESEESGLPTICQEPHAAEGITSNAFYSQAQAEALQARLARDFPGSDYVVCKLVPVNYDSLPERMSHFHGADRDTGSACVYHIISEAYVRELERRLGIGVPK